jgi:hypothetical protein
MDQGEKHLHHVACSLLRSSCNHSSSGLPRSAFSIKVSFSLGVKMVLLMHMAATLLSLKHIWLLVIYVVVWVPLVDS